MEVSIVTSASVLDIEVKGLVYIVSWNNYGHFLSLQFF
jgi:hypothetical protein